MKKLLARVSEKDISVFKPDDILVVGSSLPANPQIEFRYCDFTDINAIVDTIEVLVEDFPELGGFFLGSQGLSNFKFSDLASVYLSQNHLMRCLLGPYVLYTELQRIYKDEIGGFHICQSVQLEDCEKITAFFGLLGIPLD
jgi:hypothetical protein